MMLAKRNYAEYHDMNINSVSIKDIEKSKLGLCGWVDRLKDDNNVVENGRKYEEMEQYAKLKDEYDKILEK